MITSTTQQLTLNLVIVRSAGVCHRIREIVTPVSIFYLFKQTIWPSCTPAQIAWYDDELTNLAILSIELEIADRNGFSNATETFSLTTSRRVLT